MRTNTSSPIFSHEKEERRRGEKEKINAEAALDPATLCPRYFAGAKAQKKTHTVKHMSKSAHILTKLKFVQQLTFSAPAKKK